METYNKTQLTPQGEFDKHIYHRDQFAHFLRWSYVLNLSERFMNILDFGCGTAELCEVFYRNRKRPLNYIGIDVRDSVIKKNLEKEYPFNTDFVCHDLTVPLKVMVPLTDASLLAVETKMPWDIITCFEVIEHIPKDKQHLLLQNLRDNASEDTIILISTPNYDEHKGAANNHIVNQEICERTYDEMIKMLDDNGLHLVKAYGTFADVKIIENNLSSSDKMAFYKLKEYHDVNVLSVMFAPLIPQHARNVLYVCKMKMISK